MCLPGSVLPVCGLGVAILLVSADIVYVPAWHSVAGLRTWYGHFLLVSTDTVYVPTWHSVLLVHRLGVALGFVSADTVSCCACLAASLWTWHCCCVVLQTRFSVLILLPVCGLSVAIFISVRLQLCACLAQCCQSVDLAWPLCQWTLLQWVSVCGHCLMCLLNAECCRSADSAWPLN